MIIEDPRSSDLFFALKCDSVAFGEAVSHFGGNEPEALLVLKLFLDLLHAHGLMIGAIDGFNTIRRHGPGGTTVARPAAWPALE